MSRDGRSSREHDDRKRRRRYSDESDEDYSYRPSSKKTRKSNPTTIRIQEDDQQVEITNFRVSPRSVESLEKDGITKLFPIQVNTFDYVYDGRDVIGRARTGTGKTLSFSLPVIEKLIATEHRGRTPAVLCLAPTRELAKQVMKVMKGVACGRLNSLCIYGGVPYDRQQSMLHSGVDIVVGTPGRVLDLIDKGYLKLSAIKYFILDEADDMLNMGFFKDIEKIFSHIDTSVVQTLLYSATMPDWVKQIAEQYLSDDYVIIDLVGDGHENKTAEGVDHYSFNISYNDEGKRLKALETVINTYSEGAKLMIFCDTKKNAQKLIGCSHIRALTCEILHGGIAQNKRERTLQNFRDGRFRVLVCTDVAARGLDIDDIKLVVQYYPPRDSETYVHRSGRTGRAGNTGVCVTFYDRYAKNESRDMMKIEQYAKIQFKPALEGVVIDYSDSHLYSQMSSYDNGGYNNRGYNSNRGYGGGGRGGYNNRNSGYNSGSSYGDKNRGYSGNSSGGYDNNRDSRGYNGGKYSNTRQSNYNNDRSPGGYSGNSSGGYSGNGGNSYKSNNYQSRDRSRDHSRDHSRDTNRSSYSGNSSYNPSTSSTYGGSGGYSGNTSGGYSGNSSGGYSGNSSGYSGNSGYSSGGYSGSANSGYSGSSSGGYKPTGATSGGYSSNSGGYSGGTGYPPPSNYNQYAPTGNTTGGYRPPTGNTTGGYRPPSGNTTGGYRPSGNSTGGYRPPPRNPPSGSSTNYSGYSGYSG